MAPGEDIDSGMDSPATEETPVKKRFIEEEDDEVMRHLKANTVLLITCNPKHFTFKYAYSDDDKSFEDNFCKFMEDETLSERLWGLTEMFPNKVRSITWNIVTKTYKSIKCVYSFSRNATWIFFSSSIILFAPVIFEVERANMEEAQRREQKQVLLGPNAALSGGPGPGLIPSR